jgi:hypothetical protein
MVQSAGEDSRGCRTHILERTGQGMVQSAGRDNGRAEDGDSQPGEDGVACGAVSWWG